MDDLISRRVAIELLNRIPRIKGIGMELLIAAPDVEEMIAGLPAVDAAPVKHGRWIMTGGMKPPEYHHHHQCSVCESYAPMQMPYGAREALSPFCPGCGAKMDLEGLDETDRP